MLELIKKNIPTNSFARGVVTLVSGTAGAQAMLVLAAPLLTRLYSPEDFGFLAIFVSILALLRVIASLRYELAIALPNDDGEAANIVMVCLLLLMLTSLLTAVMVLFFGEDIADILGVPKFANYCWLLPFGVLSIGLYTVFSYWGIRTKQFSTIAATKLTQAFTTLVIQLTTFKLGSVGLLLGHIVGQGMGTTRIALPALRTPAFRSISTQKIKAAAVRYKRFPIFSTWAGLLNTAGLQLPPLLFAVFFNPAVAGVYALAHRVLNLPLSIIGSAVGQVFYSNAAEAHRTGKLGTMVEQLHCRLAHIGFPPALLLILIGPNIFDFVFGDEWRDAGNFARWMAPWIYLVFVCSPLSTVISVVERQKEGLAFQVILVVTRTISIILGFWLDDLYLTIKLFAGASALCWLGFLFWLGYAVKSNPRRMFSPTVSAALTALLCASPVVISLSISDFYDYWGLAFTVSIIMIAVRYWLLFRTIN